MICSVCKKSEATLHLTQIIENKMQKIDLCESCSKAKGVDDPTGFSLAAIVLGLGASQELAKPGASEEIKCSQCGFSLADFKKAGRLGCAECYVAFADALQAPLKSMHKGTRHVGKAPQTQPPILDYSEKLRALQKKLEQAVAKESFEQAAVLRDEIKKVKELMAPAKG